jgi:hypothetical protein
MGPFVIPINSAHLLPTSIFASLCSSLEQYLINMYNAFSFLFDLLDSFIRASFTDFGGARNVLPKITPALALLPCSHSLNPKFQAVIILDYIIELYSCNTVTSICGVLAKHNMHIAIY